MRATPARVNTATSVATSSGSPHGMPALPRISPRCLAHDHPIEIRRRHVAQWALDARQNPRGPYVGVLIVGVADGQTQPPQGYVIGHAGSAHRSEENGVGGAQFREAISRHHHAVSPVIVRAPIEVFDLQFEAFHAGANLQHFKTRRNHFFADAIARDGCYLYVLVLT